MGVGLIRVIVAASGRPVDSSERSLASGAGVTHGSGYKGYTGAVRSATKGKTGDSGRMWFSFGVGGDGGDTVGTEYRNFKVRLYSSSRRKPSSRDFL